jgi:hypothetical protein
MEIRFRALTSKFSSKELLATVQASASTVPVGELLDAVSDVPGHRNRARLQAGAVASAGLINGVTGLAGLVTGYANAPKDVESDEQVATVDAAHALLEEGKLSPSDLVNMGTGWQTFAECGEFDDTCHEILNRDRRSRLFFVAAIIGLVALTVAAMVKLS